MLEIHSGKEVFVSNGYLKNVISALLGKQPHTNEIHEASRSSHNQPPSPPVASSQEIERLTEAPKYLEESLHLTIKELLPVMFDRIVNKTNYFGVRAFKNPLDFWVYQEIIYEMKPDVIVEIGVHCAGSTLALAHLCDLLGKGKVIGLDISTELVPAVVRNHPRITLMESDACEAFPKVAEMIKSDDIVLVIEDSSHTYDNTLKVMRTYSPLVKLGDYMIVEDGNCHHGLDVGPNPGPYEAIESFVEENRDFVIDRSREDFLITWNPKGFLKRIG